MNQLSLKPGDRNKLEGIIQGKANELKRPAQIILLIDQGNSIRQVASKLGLSRSSVFYWIRRFRAYRMNIFDIPQLEQTDETHLSIPEVVQEIIPQEARSNILPDDILAEAGRKILLLHFTEMLKHEAGTISGKNIESLHDMRVATRRMRAAFEVFGNAFGKRITKTHLKGLRQTGRKLGRVRDVDVFIEKASGYLVGLPEQKRNSLDPLLKIWNEQREFERAMMLSYLQSSTYREFKERFNQFLQTPFTTASRAADLENGSPNILDKAKQSVVRDTVPLLVYERLAGVNAFESVLPTATVTQMHALRIEFKRLRYTLEFFSEVLGPQTRGIIREIKSIQDHLGDLHDSNIAVVLLGNLLNTWEDQHRQVPLETRPDPQSVIEYLAYCARERHQLIKNFPPLWKRFTQSEFRQNLALAIAGL
jgi:CHAD domain-containing protein